MALAGFSCKPKALDKTDWDDFESGLETAFEDVDKEIHLYQHLQSCVLNQKCVSSTPKYSMQHNT